MVKSASRIVLWIYDILGIRNDFENYLKESSWLFSD